jgi:hypothetical protein
VPVGKIEKRVTMAAVRAPRSLRQSSPPDQDRRRGRRRHLDGASHAGGHHRPTSACWPQPISLHGVMLTAIATPTTRRCFQRYAANSSPLCLPRTGASPCPDRASPRSRIPCMSCMTDMRFMPSRRARNQNARASIRIGIDAGRHADHSRDDLMGRDGLLSSQAQKPTVRDC